MQINISNLSEGSHTYDLTEETRFLGLSENFSGQVNAHVTLEKSLNQILATVSASVKGIFICDRCARDYESDITTSFHSVYSWDHDDGQGDDDDFFLLARDQNIIDISKSVKEYLTLAVPLKHICGKKDCTIPAYVMKKDDSIDPRWEKLKTLKR